MITAIFSAIAALPALLSTIEKAMAWVAEQIEQAKKRKAVSDLEKAMQVAQEKKDTSGMDQVFDSDKK